jgi:glycosyltransferase involved in cell wall biosynthesis
MSDKPLVSAVIPHYNSNFDWVKEAIRSIEDQTYENIELVIVDDGSTNRSLDKIRDLDISIPCRIVEHEENRGISETRNTGVRESGGEYISIIDQDDQWNPEKIEKQVECFERNDKLGICYTNYVVIDGDGEQIGERNYQYGLDSLDTEGIAEYLFNKNWKYETHNPLPLTSSMIRRAVFEDVGYFDPELYGANDRELLMRSIKNWEISIIEENLQVKRFHSDNASKNTDEMIDDRFRLMNKYIQTFPFLEKYSSKQESMAYQNYVVYYLERDNYAGVLKNWLKAFRADLSLTIERSLNYFLRKAGLKEEDRLEVF